MVTCSSILAWEIPQRSLVGYSPWGRQELDLTEHSTAQGWVQVREPSFLLNE